MTKVWTRVARRAAVCALPALLAWPALGATVLALALIAAVTAFYRRPSP